MSVTAFSISALLARQKKKKTTITGERLKAIIDDIENAEIEKAVWSDKIKDLYANAKYSGFDVRIIRALIRIRKADPQDIQEQDAILALYMQALGEARPQETTKQDEED